MHRYHFPYLVNMIMSRTTSTLWRVLPAMLVILATCNYRRETQSRLKLGYFGPRRIIELVNDTRCQVIFSLGYHRDVQHGVVSPGLKMVNILQFWWEKIHIFIPQCNHILLDENSVEKDLFSITPFEREWKAIL